MEYVSYLDIAKNLNINKGDKVYIGSDIRPIMVACMRNKEPFNTELFIESFVDKIGPEGTILFPTYTWDFCKGLPFDYIHSPGQVGSMGTCALKMKKFKRTGHPIYSFAVFGKDQNLLYNMENKESFGIGTPFEYLCENRVKLLTVGIDWSHLYTYIHHVERMVGDLPYRYLKDFTSKYIDEFGECSDRTYSMYVRKLELNPVPNDIAMKRLVENACPVEQKIINNALFQSFEFYRTTEVLKNDIVHNKSRNITSYIGQN